MPALTALSCLTLCQPVLAEGAAGVIPRPQIEDYGRGSARFEPHAAQFKVAFKNINPAESAPCEGGLRLLSKRLKLLGGGEVTVEAGRGDAQVVITKASVKQLSRMLRGHGAREEATGKRLEQAYTLVCRPAYRGRGVVQIAAYSELGIYYALVSLCQLLDKDEQGNLCLPVVTLGDWPEIGLRLAKTSASTSPLPELNDTQLGCRCTR